MVRLPFYFNMNNSSKLTEKYSDEIIEEMQMKQLTEEILRIRDVTIRENR